MRLRRRRREKGRASAALLPNLLTFPPDPLSAYFRACSGVIARPAAHAAPSAARLMAPLLGWDDARVAAELAAYEAIARDRLP